MKIQDIRHVGLLSPAIAAHAQYHMEVLGLQSVGEDRHARYLRAASTEHHILSLHPADRTGLHHLAFRLDGRAAVDAAATELEGRGIPLVAQPDDLDEPGGGYGLRFLDPENRCIELSAGVGRTPEPLVDQESRPPPPVPRRSQHSVVGAGRGVLHRLSRVPDLGPN